MNIPRFLIADPLPSQCTEDTPEYVLCTNPPSLWAFDDEGNGIMVKNYTPLEPNPATLAKLARETGEWLATYRHEEEQIAENLGH